jgi:hypothetical protein
VALRWGVRALDAKSRRMGPCGRPSEGILISGNKLDSCHFGKDYWTRLLDRVEASITVNKRMNPQPIGNEGNRFTRPKWQAQSSALVMGRYWERDLLILCAQSIFYTSKYLLPAVFFEFVTRTGGECIDLDSPSSWHSGTSTILLT